MLNRHIVRERQNKNANRIRQNIESLRRNGGGVKEESFWEFKKKMSKRKLEKQVAMKDENGDIQTEPKKIKEIYTKFYNELFKVEVEDQLKEKGKTVKERIEKKGKQQQPINIEEEDIEKVIKTLKRRKAGDQEGWRNEMLICGGKEMVRSLAILFNRISKEMELPTQW
mgnify:CR=1 FL=1